MIELLFRLDMVYKKTTSIIVIFLLVSLGFVSVVNTLGTENVIAASGDDGSQNDIDLNKLEVGDIILTSGSSLDKIVPGRWTHSMIYIGEGKIIDPVEEGVVINDVEKVHDSDEAAIYRVEASEQVRKKAVEFAIRQEGKPYDLGWYTKQVHGDSYYCSELAWASYKTQGVDIDENPGWSWSYANGVAPTEIADDADTFRVAHAD
ncbi:MAG: YiiX/YebB-like N1pC/P60 family cysteine hydrolase [Thermoplasmatota archaeon]